MVQFEPTTSKPGPRNTLQKQHGRRFRKTGYITLPVHSDPWARLAAISYARMVRHEDPKMSREVLALLDRVPLQEPPPTLKDKARKLWNQTITRLTGRQR